MYYKVKGEVKVKGKKTYRRGREAESAWSAFPDSSARMRGTMFTKSKCTL